MLNKSFFLAGLIGATSLASAAVYQTGFESTTYTAGQSVNGVDGWTLSNQSDRLTATIVDTAYASGSQALKVQMIPHWGDSSVNLGLSTPVTANTTGVISIKWNFLQDNSDSEAPLNVVVWIGDGVNTPLDIRISDTGVIEAYSVYNLLSVGTLTAGSWNSFEVLLDTTHDTYNIVLNGTKVWATDVALKANVDATSISSLTFYQVPYKRGIYYIDGVSISETAVPEPAALGMISLAGLALLARRRR